MKLALIASVLLLATASHAEVKEPGTFVPSLCSEKQTDEVRPSVVAVEGVCLGKVVGSEGSVIQLTLNDGAVRLYSVELERSQPRMGSHTSKFTGNVMTIKMIDNISGQLKTTSGITVTHDITLETSTTNLKFSGPMQMVFVTQ